MAQAETKKREIPVERENALSGILAKCGFVENPTVTATTFQKVNPADYAKLDRLLRELYGSSGKGRAQAG